MPDPPRQAPLVDEQKEHGGGERAQNPPSPAYVCRHHSYLRLHTEFHWRRYLVIGSSYRFNPSSKTFHDPIGIAAQRRRKPSFETQQEAQQIHLQQVRQLGRVAAAFDLQQLVEENVPRNSLSKQLDIERPLAPF